MVVIYGAYTHTALANSSRTRLKEKRFVMSETVVLEPPCYNVQMRNRVISHTKDNHLRLREGDHAQALMCVRGNTADYILRWNPSTQVPSFHVGVLHVLFTQRS